MIYAVMEESRVIILGQISLVHCTLEHSFDNHGCINVRVDLVSFSEILTFTLNRPLQLPENYQIAVIHSI